MAVFRGEQRPPLCPQLLCLVPQFSSVQSLSCVQLYDPMNRSSQASLSITSSLSLHKLMSIAVGDAIQPSHPLLSPSPPWLHIGFSCCKPLTMSRRAICPGLRGHGPGGARPSIRGSTWHGCSCSCGSFSPLPAPPQLSSSLLPSDPQTPVLQPLTPGAPSPVHAGILEGANHPVPSLPVGLGLSNLCFSPLLPSI